MKNKKYELLAKYFADLSKIFFSAIVVKQFIEHRINLPELVFGISLSIILLVAGYVIQPKE